MLFPLFILIGFGGLVLYSAAGGSLDPYAGSHLVRFGVFLVMAIIMSLFPPDIVRLAAYPVYVLVLILLVIVEAMKVMNPIRAPRGGTVSQIMVENGSPVEFGETLLVLG